MARPRFTIAGLMVAVALIAVGAAALVHPSRFWASALPSLAALMVPVAVLGASLRRGRERAFWIGFAVFEVALLLFNSGVLFHGRYQKPLWLFGELADYYTDFLAYRNRGYAREFFGYHMERAHDYNDFIITPMMNLIASTLGGLLGRHFAGGGPGPEA